ncbi:radical SAM/SPASM domain-containing protein [Okeania sp. SIO1I7]|uniref:radical SAM/SPASM domain-containing protein n=1 Tax=Okeania sp. SIO1I7 TaxID=2607772 RepID=UPI0013FA8AD7|nr:radical SAM protein [Okeania sp. SIO1I7]NET28346.1 radical SAM protein [Okeania sp. SIO1I7]
MLSLTETPVFSTEDTRFQEISNLIVKVTNRCNLNCSYCYENIVQKGQDMDLKTFKNLVDKVMKNSVQNRINFILHGGEPTLIGIEWITAAVEYAKQQAKIYGKSTTFGIQTNMIALTDKLINTFIDLNVHISCSLDGPHYLKGAMRDYAQKAYQCYQLARKLDANVGILMTINHSNYQYFTEIIDWLKNELQVREFKANVITSVGAGYNLPPLSAEQVFTAQKDILNAMIKTEGKEIVEENLKVELLRFFDNNRRETLCAEKTCGAGKRVVGITPDGSLLPCGRFQWDDYNFQLGHLSEKINSQVAENFQKSVQNFHSLVPESWYDCESCSARKICSYGCQAFIVRSKEKANVECLPTKMKYRFFEENRDKLLPVVNSIREKYDESRQPESDYPDYQDEITYRDYQDYSDQFYKDSTYTDGGHGW